MEVWFWISLTSLIYVYFGYLGFLKLISIVKKVRTCDTAVYNDCFPIVSVIVAAYNEEKSIGRRIENLLEQNYPKDKLEIIVASDGSTDRTVRIAKQFLGVKVLDFKENRGRAAIQNDGVKIAKGEVIVFTDSETEFEKNFLRRITEYFFYEKVGCVVGNLVYRTQRTSISESEGFYWKLEKKLRRLESDLGILSTATGACMAVRKNLWKDLAPIDDSDFTTPLDVILQGYKIVYAPDAIAYDIPPSSVKGELRARIRQTSKNLIGTLKRWGWRGWIKHPFVSWGLLSHKILRWLTLFFMIGAFISNLFLLNKGILYQLTFAGQVIFYLIAVIGMAGEFLKVRIRIASMIFSFCIANIGMGIGVIKGILGKAPGAYKMEE